MVQKKHAELILIGALVAVTILSIVQSENIATIAMAGEMLTSRLYVVLMDICLLITLAFRALFVVAWPEKKAKPSKADLKTFAEKKLMYILMACAVVYAFGIIEIGFYITTFIFLLGVFVMLEGVSKKSILSGVLFSLGVNGVFFLAFDWLKIYLPNGLLF